MSAETVYRHAGIAVGAVAAMVAWVYAIATYGFFLGVGLGWIPALIIGVVAGLLWPLILLGLLGIVFLIFKARPDWLVSCLLVAGVSLLMLLLLAGPLWLIDRARYGKPSNWWRWPSSGTTRARRSSHG